MGSGLQSFLALKLLLNILEKSKTNIADKAKPRVIVGRLPAVIGGGPAWSKDAGGESHACVPKRCKACGSACMPVT